MANRKLKEFLRNLSTNQRKCAFCGREFKGREGLYNHLVDFHKREPAPSMFAKTKRAARLDAGEESYGERAVQAEIDRAMGCPGDDDWLLG